jgi:hypothetical protein
MSDPGWPPPIEDEVYRGYEAEDLARVAALHHPAKRAWGFVTDYFGVKTSLERAPWLAGRSGQVIKTPPFPDDGFLAEGVEYAAAAIALAQAAPGGPFTFFEIGAGWGPWTALIATLAPRLGFTPVTAVGIEADAKRFAQLQAHLFDNGLLPTPEATRIKRGGLTVKALHGAGWWRKETLLFPADATVEDAGLAVVKGSSPEIDYRGKRFAYEKVKALDIHALFEPYPVVDFIHVDIQGAEWELISNSLDLLDRKVRFMLVGTHNRKIEGDLIELLLSRGWKLFREKPCRFYGMADTPSLTGMTYKDGAQFWRNMKLL